MSEHVWVRLEAEPCLESCPLNHPGETGGGERRATL
jgi:hypothetical protein